MIEHVLFDFKTSKMQWFDHFEEVYLEKISHFCKINIFHLKSPSVEREQSQEKLKAEELLLLKKLTSDDYVILLDERGKKLDSIQFADAHVKAISSGKKRLVFIIGGAFGVTDLIRQRANLILCLSSLVMNHLIAESVLLEQIYRSFTIQKRIPYHNI